MAEVIGSAAYQMILDSTKFEKGASLTRREASALRKTLRDIETPAEKHQRKLDLLSEQYRKGALTSEQLRRAVDKLEKEYKQATSAANNAASGQQNFEKSMISAELKTAAFTKGLELAKQAQQALFEEAKEMDQIAKAADKLGVLTSELVGLQHAAERMSGMTRGQFTTAFQRMTRRVAEAAQGTGEAKKAIEELGLSAEELAKDPANAFLMIADAIKDVESESDRLRLAFKLFDSEGAALVTTLGQGSEAIREMQKRAEELGLTFSQEEAEAVQKLNDALADTQALLEGLYRQTASGIAPQMMQDVQELTKILGGGTATAGGGMLSGLASAFYEAFSPVAWLGNIAEFNNAVADAATDAMTTGGKRVAQMEEELRLQKEIAAEAEKARDAKEPRYGIDSSHTSTVAGGVAGFFSGAGEMMGRGISAGMDWAEDQAAQEQNRRRDKKLDEREAERLRKEEAAAQKQFDEQWKLVEKEEAARKKADEDRRKQWESIGMGGVTAGSAEAYRLRREMDKKKEVQTVRIVDDQADILRTEVEVGVGAAGGLDIDTSGVV